jgi:hypothetical protein
MVSNSPLLIITWPMIWQIFTTMFLLFKILFPYILILILLSVFEIWISKIAKRKRNVMRGRKH